MDEIDLLYLMTPGRAPDVAALLAELVNRPAWHQWAACRGMGTDQFIVRHRGHYEESARALCERCPVRQERLETALANRRTVGLWGGTSPMERRAMRRGVVA